MNAFSLELLYNEKPNAFLTAIRQRLMFALGMRDARNDDYANEDRVNNGYESDAYWAGRMLAGQLMRDYAMWRELVEISLID